LLALLAILVIQALLEQLVQRDLQDPQVPLAPQVSLETLAPKVSLETLVLMALTVIVLTKLLFLTGSQALNPNGWIALLGLKDQQVQDLYILENGILQPPTTSVMS
jgi:hypothetical protein